MSENESKFAVAHPSPLDRAIDRAVRDMVHVDPPAGLRRRVTARILRPAARSSAFFPRYAVAAAALVMIALLVDVLRPDVPPAAPVGHRAAAQTAPPDPAIRADSDTVPLTPSPERPAPRRARGPHTETIVMPKIANLFGRPDGGVAAATLGVPAGPPAPTAGAAAGEVGEVGALPLEQPIAITQILIRPLEVEPLHIEPLPTRR